MAVKIVGTAPDGTIAGDELRDGQIAVFVNGDPTYIGWIVQQSGDRVFVLGKPSGYSFADGLNHSVRLRVLPNGTKIEVEDNEQWPIEE